MTAPKIPQIAHQDYPREPVELENLSTRFMKQAKFLPLELRGNTLRIAMAEPDDAKTMEALKFAFGLNLEICRGRVDEILESIERLYGSGRQSMETIIEEAHKNIYDISNSKDADIDRLIDMASEAPIIRLVNRLILNAVDMKASDIHFEPFENEFSVRYRLDGVLHEIEFPPKRLQPAIISRLKIMSKLDISERRLPQDGRISLRIADREIDFRVSTIPTLFGESLVMRILDRQNLVLDLEKLGFPEKLQARYEDLIHQPYGMILVTGPTGSGKTSTLYTTLAKVVSPEIKIITLEDPIEYQLKGINQIQVNPKIDLTFANGLRSIVRQDPDIILVGEIRDHETAQIAVQSALTGHLLFSTLHTNDSVGAITRLQEMGVENFLLTSTLLGVLAQRLVRVICPHCKRPATPDDKLIRAMNMTSGESTVIRFYEGAGCPECHHTGYKGRVGIFEYLPMDDDIRREIMASADVDQIRRIAVEKGLVTLRQDGWQKVKQGITTIREVLRVTIAE